MKNKANHIVKQTFCNADRRMSSVQHTYININEKQGIGKMRKCEMRKVKCGMKSAECTCGMACRMQNAESL